MPFTPGPWRVDETKALGAYGVWTDYPTHPGDDGAGYPSQICSVLPDKRQVSREERDANARLIAACPYLLAACETVIARHDEKARAANFATCGCDDCTPLRAAVEKARGGP